MIIAVDIDGTINNLTEKVLELYNADSGQSLRKEDITTYWFDSMFISPYKERAETYFVEAVPMTSPVFGAVDVLSKLHEEGHVIYFVTSTSFLSMPTKAQWLKQHFSFVSDSKIVRLCDKQLFQCDVIIDDYHENLTGGQGRKILFDQPWNKNLGNRSDLQNVTRASNWLDIYRMITDGGIE